MPTGFTTGNSPDISHLVEFSWWDWVWYISPQSQLSIYNFERWLGSESEVGDALCYKILTSAGNKISRTTIFPLSTGDHNSPAVLTLKKEFDTYLAPKLLSNVS